MSDADWVQPFDADLSIDRNVLDREHARPAAQSEPLGPRCEARRRSRLAPLPPFSGPPGLMWRSLVEWPPLPEARLQSKAKQLTLRSIAGLP